MPRCIVCNNPQSQRQPGLGDFARFDCPRCGSFALTGSAETALQGLLVEVPQRRSLMSHTLRRMQRKGQTSFHTTTTDELPTFWKNVRLPTPPEQADNFVLWMGDNHDTPFTWIDTTASTIAAMVGMAISNEGNDSGAWAWLNTQLSARGLYRLQENAPAGIVRIMLEMAGWEKYELLKTLRIESRTAFMALKFGQQHVDQMVNECARPAVSRAGFQLRVLTDQQGAGLIDNQMRAALLSARFVISDLTDGSYGAYWEAGFGEGRGIPVIYTCEQTQWERNKTHFDTNHMATIIWNIADLKKAEDALVAMIRATLRAEAKQTDD
jgi:hypothetical protein